MIALVGAPVAHGACARAHRAAGGDTAEQSLCIARDGSAATYRVAVRLRGGSTSQTVVLRLQHREPTGWVTDQAAGLSYSSPATHVGGRTEATPEPVGRSIITLRFDRAVLRRLRRNGARLRVRASSRTARGSRTLTASLRRAFDV